jgi:hypothetical protein
MIYRLSASDAFMLLHKPESGLGYQIIDAIPFPEYKEKRFVVYNTELAINLDNEFEYYKYRIFRDGYTNTINSRSTIGLNFRSFNLVEGLRHERPKPTLEDIIKTKQRHSGGKAAVENPIEYADGSEVFVRLSAYDNDKRIDFDRKKLRPGSYTTTDQDYGVCVLLKDDPVDRYALPNDESIKWAFFIQPKKENTLQRGIVQPAFNHIGGGIEAYFEKGTSDFTYLLKKTYGQR